MSDSFAKVKSSRLSLSMIEKEMRRVKCYVSIVVDVELKGVSHTSTKRATLVMIACQAPNQKFKEAGLASPS